MNPIRISGVVLFVIGIILLGFVNHASNAPLEQLSNTLTGRYSNQTMWYLLLGTAAAVSGALMTLFGKRA